MKPIVATANGVGARHPARDEPATSHLEWLRAFERRHGRPLRVLHVGNIANNAYLNAKFLRSVGVEAHVLCYDYSHVMATPEWEEVELLHDHGDDYLPNFAERDLRGYRRPSWFVTGPLFACVSQVAALSGQHLPWWRRVVDGLVKRLVAATARQFGPVTGHVVHLLIIEPRLFAYKLWAYLKSKLGAGHPLLVLLSKHGRPLLVLLSKHGHPLKRALRRRLLRAGDTTSLSALIADFDEAFPQRADRLSADDLAPFLSVTTRFRDVFRHYDIVQCYATDPIHALLAGKRPYLAFEHGTLRDFTMGDTALHRLTALAYWRADHTFITNGDCLAYAERLGIERFSPIIHPVDIEQHRQDFGGAIAALRREIGGEVVLFCPLRHDWKVKGTDVNLRALPIIKDRLAVPVKLVLIRWGLQIDDSTRLIESLGCEGDVVWRPSMCRITMIKHLRAADVVLDQMALPCFGATAPQAIAAGTPVISSYVSESTRWIIPEPAPILSAFSPEEVADAVSQALDPGWLADYKKRARHWSDTYHHPDNVIRGHLDAYRRVLEV